ncbi:hypothetical protein VNO80_22602 [Phaseolus coccineus]|uniref:Uncharacterized protein n=1 Tax=Phaseolus coccineus TaxID=3886 RepID=A0AAN9MAU9_PHACN
MAIKPKERENARYLLHDTVRFDASWWLTVCVHSEREPSFSRGRRRFRLASHHRRLSQSQCFWQTKELLSCSRSRDRLCSHTNLGYGAAIFGNIQDYACWSCCRNQCSHDSVLSLQRGNWWQPSPHKR